LGATDTRIDLDPSIADRDLQVADGGAYPLGSGGGVLAIGFR
jgi:hypothetical protein